MALGADRLVGGDEVVEWLTIRQTLGLQRIPQLGVVARALQMTAEYAREREQFDRPIGSFRRSRNGSPTATSTSRACA